MLGDCPLSNYFPEAIAVLFVLLVLHFKLMRLESGFSNHMIILSKVLQIEYFLGNLQVFSFDPLLFQFSSTDV